MVLALLFAAWLVISGVLLLRTAVRWKDIEPVRPEFRR